MRTEYSDRSVSLARYMIENRCTVRDAAAWFGVSKSTVHKDVTEKLAQTSPALFREVKQLLETNKAERHLRGGEATRIKYQQMREAEEAGETGETRLLEKKPGKSFQIG